MHSRVSLTLKLAGGCHSTSGVTNGIKKRGYYQVVKSLRLRRWSVVPRSRFQDQQVDHTGSSNTIRYFSEGRKEERSNAWSGHHQKGLSEMQGGNRVQRIQPFHVIYFRPKNSIYSWRVSSLTKSSDSNARGHTPSTATCYTASRIGPFSQGAKWSKHHYLTGLETMRVISHVRPAERFHLNINTYLNRLSPLAVDI